WPLQFAFTFCHEVPDRFVGVPKVAQNTQLMLGKTGAHRICLHHIWIEPFLLHVDAVGWVIGSAHNQVECRLRASVLEDKAKEIFIVDPPLVAARFLTHLVAAVNFFEALLAAELADPLPAQKAAIKKSRAITQPFENTGGRSWQPFADGRLIVDQHAGEREASDENAQTLNRADA